MKKGKRNKQEQIVLERCATLNFEKLLAFPYHEFPHFINPTWISGKQSILLIFLTKFFILFFHWSSKLAKRAVGGFLCLKASDWLPWWLCVWLLLCYRLSTHKSQICGSPFFVSYWDVLYRGSKQKSSIWASRFLAVTVMMVWMFCSLMIVNTW